jgi:hypothetical protein
MGKTGAQNGSEATAKHAPSVQGHCKTEASYARRTIRAKAAPTFRAPRTYSIGSRALCLRTAWCAPSHILISYCPTRNCERSSLRSREFEQSCNFSIDSFASSARVEYTTALQLYRLHNHA